MAGIEDLPNELLVKMMSYHDLDSLWAIGIKMKFYIFNISLWIDNNNLIMIKMKKFKEMKNI